MSEATYAGFKDWPISPKKKFSRKKIEYKTKEERQADVKNIIKELSKFELTMTYEPIKQLYKHFKDFIDNGNHIKVNIPFPMIQRRIKGLLPDTVNEKCWVKLVSE